MKTILKGIILFVQDTDKLKSFYTDNFNFEVIEEIKSEWVLLNAGGFELGLHKSNQHLVSSEKSSCENSNAKIVLEIDEDIFSIRELLLKKNTALREIKTFENYDYWLCDGEDPEGNVFQIKQKK